MNMAPLKKFAQKARRELLAQTGARLAAVLSEDSLERRENPEAMALLKKALDSKGRQQVIENAACMWFSRFCALRLMDLRHYIDLGVISPGEGQSQPEILTEAKAGEIDAKLLPDAQMRQRVLDLLFGKHASPDSEGQAYRLLLIGACNHWHKCLPSLFGPINEPATLLLPDDLLSDKSVPAQTLAVINAENCQNVEIIGWLYQFYIADKKDAVFANKNGKIAPRDIPAATQLFTPAWIARYLVENSLGRLWLLNRPQSDLAAQMPYYIAPERPETEFLKVNSPEDLKICDPACGSGHMLVYAFDLLHRIYLEEGYDEADIPGKILQNNLYGLEIDRRAAELAVFALALKAREKQRHIFSQKLEPHILALENITFGEEEKLRYRQFIGQDISDELSALMDQFEEADNFGSLIRPCLKNAGQWRQMLEKLDVGADLLLQPIHKKVLKILRMAEYLSPRYHVVIANPPYMGNRGMNARLSAWLNENYKDVKSDLFSAFVARNTELALVCGQLGFMTPFVWMFISSHEKLRQFLIGQKTITSLAQLEYSGFDDATAPICAFTLENGRKQNFRGGYIRLSNFRGSENQEPKTLEAIQNPACGWFFRASAADFAKIPGSPIAYWVSDKLRKIFADNKSLGEIAEAKQGLATADNKRFVRRWQEVSQEKIGYGFASGQDARASGLKWFPYNKGGNFRKWYGNQEFVLNWENDGEELKAFKPKAVIRNPAYYFRQAAGWSKISSSKLAMRYYPNGYIFDVAGCCIFTEHEDALLRIISFCNSKLSRRILKTLSPTLNFEVGQISRLPISNNMDFDTSIVAKLIRLAKIDWDSHETSWDFSTLPLLSPEYHKDTLEAAYAALRDHWRHMTLEMQRLEEENNRIFIEAYGLEGELTPEAPLPEITLTCNPHYRYGGNKSEEELEALLLADAMREFISYAVGCMFGRYALEKPCLILASQGQTLADYNSRVPQAKFQPAADNIIPVLAGEYFKDDIVGRFHKFLALSFGTKYFADNLAFMERALGKDIRKYFLRDFYVDHLKRYKKRPIYWLFQSSGCEFAALVYMHRYNRDTVGILQAGYLRAYMAKLEAEKMAAQHVAISQDSSAAQKNRTAHKIAALQKTIKALKKYESEILYPLAARKLEIDLDDGVIVNYAKFGAALKKISGLEG